MKPARPSKPWKHRMSQQYFGVSSWGHVEKGLHDIPVNGDTLRPPREEICGQCQESVASLHCRECREHFCSTCSANIHQRGRLREHTLLPLQRRFLVLGTLNHILFTGCRLCRRPFGFQDSRHRDIEGVTGVEAAGRDGRQACRLTGIGKACRRLPPCGEH